MTLPAKPFLTWTGGKATLRKTIMKYAPDCMVYHEPFLGGGSIFFGMAEANKFKHSAYLSDYNLDVVTLWQQVQVNVEGLIKALLVLKAEYLKDSKHTFLRMRALVPTILEPVDRAARMMFLNATAFSHVHSVNRNGQFNTPMAPADFSHFICREERLRAAHYYLNRKMVSIRHSSFDYALLSNKPQKNDLVYLDPPYHPVTTTARFAGYNASGFSKDQQWRLWSIYTAMATEGVACIMSNSDVPWIHNIYDDYRIIKIVAKRRINCHKNEAQQATYETLVLANI